MRGSSTFLMLAVAALFALPATAGDAPKTKRIANVEYANWAQFQVGAFAELTTEAETMGQKTKTIMTHKLVELTKEKAVVETSMAIEGMPAEYAPKPTRRDVPKEVEVPDVKAPDAPDVKVKEGEETIDVAGTSLKCKTTESTSVVGEMTATSKTWTTDGLPGMVAKVEVKSEGKIGDQPFTSTSTTTVTKWSAK